MDFGGKILLTYGPFALFGFMVYVLLNKAKPSIGMTGRERTLQLAVYWLVWLSIFALSVTIVYIWMDLNVPSREVVIQGTIRHLQEPETFFSENPLFLRKVYEPNNRYGYEWRIITSHKLADGESVTLYFQKDSNVANEAASYLLKIRPTFYDHPVDIIYSRASGKLALSHAGQVEDLILRSSLGHPRQLKGQLFLTVVHAQNTTRLTEIDAALSSNDPIIRRNGRAELTVQGANGVPYISSVLSPSAGLGRSALGALTALNEMRHGEGKLLTRAAKCNVIHIAAGEIETDLRTQALFYVHLSYEDLRELGCSADDYKKLSVPELSLEARQLKDLEERHSLVIYFEPASSAISAQERSKTAKIVGELIAVKHGSPIAVHLSASVDVATAESHTLPSASALRKLVTARAETARTLLKALLPKDTTIYMDKEEPSPQCLHTSDEDVCAKFYRRVVASFQ